ncbi:MAG TPA: bifunctional sugar-1-phosphate nucleotidylyltransferase/acetyltransferase [archaeon]|nr:bifunctional sugar-1-phosphate nucleotidylyltransferase/acetyltransferase [archaeon]
MKVVFLCGGIGKRMHPITEEKTLINFVGKTLLEHQLETLTAAGFREFVLVCSPFNEEKIRSICSRLRYKIEFAVQKEPKGMADAVLSAKHLLDGEILVINPNDYCDVTAYEKIMQASKTNADVMILGYKVASYFPGGYLKTSSDGNLMEIVEKPGEGNEPSDMINVVVHYFKDAKTAVKYFETTKSERDDVYETALSRMMKDGLKIKVLPFSGTWIPLKYPWHIFHLLKYFLDNIQTRISATAKVSTKATIEGKVVIDDNVKIFEGAAIKGPCYIGKNSVIGNNALIWNYTQIGSQSVVGYSTEVKHSWIGDNCWFHTNYIGDSIIADNCSFGAGTITANYRFDEQNVNVKVGDTRIDTGFDKFGAIVGENCKTGINVSLMPGVKVGPKSIVAAGVTLMSDLEPNKIIFVNETSFTIKDNPIKVSAEKKEELMKRLLEKK